MTQNLISFFTELVNYRDLVVWGRNIDLHMQVTSNLEATVHDEEAIIKEMTNEVDCEIYSLWSLHCVSHGLYCEN